MSLTKEIPGDPQNPEYRRYIDHIYWQRRQSPAKPGHRKIPKNVECSRCGITIQRYRRMGGTLCYLCGLDEIADRRESSILAENQRTTTAPPPPEVFTPVAYDPGPGGYTRMDPQMARLQRMDPPTLARTVAWVLERDEAPEPLETLNEVEAADRAAAYAEIVDRVERVEHHLDQILQALKRVVANAR